MYENGDNLRHYDTAQHKYFKIHVIACKDWNVTKNLTTHRTLAWQHINIHIQHDFISTKLKMIVQWLNHIILCRQYITFSTR